MKKPQGVSGLRDPPQEPPLPPSEDPPPRRRVVVQPESLQPRRLQLLRVQGRGGGGEGSLDHQGSLGPREDPEGQGKGRRGEAAEQVQGPPDPRSLKGTVLQGDQVVPSEHAEAPLPPVPSGRQADPLPIGPAGQGEDAQGVDPVPPGGQGGADPPLLLGDAGFFGQMAVGASPAAGVAPREKGHPFRATGMWIPLRTQKSRRDTTRPKQVYRAGSGPRCRLRGTSSNAPIRDAEA